MSWPLWAKIAAPGAVIFALASLGSAGAEESGDPVEAEAAMTTVAIVRLADADPTTTAAPSTTAAPTTTADPTTTAAPTTTATPTTTTTTPTTTAPPVTQPPTTPAPPPPATQAPLPPIAAPAAPPPPPPAAATDPDYGTCKVARANGAGPYYRDVDPEYDWYRDADSDGIVCE